MAKPQLRGLEGSKLTLNLGDEIPIVSTSYTPIATGGVGVNPLNSFQLKPVGINIDITPRVTLEGDVVIELNVESSSRGADVNVAGTNYPSFGSRKVSTKLRLRDGESNLLAGLLREDERKSLAGFPGRHPRPDSEAAVLEQRSAGQPDRYRDAADAPHRPHARHHRRRSEADLHRIAAEPRGRRSAAAHRGDSRSRRAQNQAPAASTTPSASEPRPPASAPGAAPTGQAPVPRGTVVAPPPGATPVPGTVLVPSPAVTPPARSNAASARPAAAPGSGDGATGRARPQMTRRSPRRDSGSLKWCSRRRDPRSGSAGGPTPCRSRSAMCRVCR